MTVYIFQTDAADFFIEANLYPSIQGIHCSPVLQREMKDDVAWTEETAREYCQKQFAYNKVYNLCTQVPSVNPDANIDVCIMDIQVKWKCL